MATAHLFHDPLWVPTDSSGATYPGAKMYVYQAGTTTAVTLYSTYDTLGSTLTNPVTADSNGKFAAVYVAKTDSYRYRRVLKTSAGVTIQDLDNLPVPTAGGSLASTYVQTTDTGKAFTGAWTFSGSVTGAAFTNLFAAPTGPVGTTTPVGGRFTYAHTAPVAVTFSATAMTVDCSLSNVFTTTFTANVTTAPSLSNAKDGQTINWFITQDGTGSRTMTWPTSFKWPGGSAGVLSTAASSVDLLTATYRSSTGFWYASLSKAFA